jgi:hypothetical protein
LNRREYFSSAALSTNKVVTRFPRRPDRANGSPAGDSREAINIDSNYLPQAVLHRFLHLPMATFGVAILHEIA